MKHLTLISLLAALAGAPAQAQWSPSQVSVPRTNMSTVVVGDFVIFAGGRDGTTVFNTVDIYDTTTGLWTATTLSIPRAGMAATAVGDLVFFAGGASTGFVMQDRVDILNTATMTWLPQAALSQARGALGATSVGTKAIFAGGGGIGFLSARVDVYDTSTGLWTIAPNLSVPRTRPTAISVGDQALFAGGAGTMGVPYATVDIYDDSLGLPPSNTAAWTATTLSEARVVGADAAATVGTRVYFAGGHFSTGGGPNMSDAIDIYDASTGFWSTMNLPVARGYMGVVAVGNTVLFGGGSLTGFVPSATVDTLNVGTGLWGVTFLSQARTGIAAAGAGGKALFAGGAAGGTSVALVDIYEPTGVNYCSAWENSTGSAATISASGSTSAAANNLTVHAVQLPPGQFGYFLASQTQGYFNPPGSQGFICLSGNIGRFNAPSQIIQGPSGSLNVDLGAIPVNPPQAVQPGESWNFQCWYRDSNPGPTSNFTDAVTVTFN